MKHQHDTREEEIRPSLQEIGGWAVALQQVHHRLAPRFARAEPHRHALLYLRAILSEIPLSGVFSLPWKRVSSLFLG